MNLLTDFVLELTDRCPLQCVHCSSDSGPSRTNQLTSDVVSRLISEAAAFGVTQISFGGGEPAISPILEDALKEVEAKGMASEVFTSGVVHAGGTIGGFPASLVRSLGRLSRLKLVFSVHGCNADMHDRITGTAGSYDAMLDSLRSCLAAGIHCEMNFVPLRANTSGFCGVLELAAEHGIKKISVLRFVPQGRGLRNRAEIELDGEGEARFVRRLLALRTMSSVRIRTGSPYNGIIPGNRVPCRAGAAKLVVQADGNVLPCEAYKHHLTRDWGLSVYGRSLQSILGSPQLQSLRDHFRCGSCLVCPVHSRLAECEEWMAASVAERVPQAAVRV